MTELNTTVENMSKEDVVEENIDLKNQNQTLLKKIEDYEQQIYETKRQLATSKLMQEELASELELVQNSGSSETDQLHKRIAYLEEENVNLKQMKSDIESDINEKDFEIESLKNKVNEQPGEKVDNSKEELIEKLNDELYELRSNNELLMQELEEDQFKINDLTKQNGTLENKIMEISKEVDELKEFLGIKRQELEAVNEHFTNVQDELAATKMELVKCKMHPADQNKKGNSLFAEVEDNRKILKKHLQQMNKKYSEMKVNYSKKTMELQKIHAAYVSLKSQVEDNNLDRDHSHIIKTYEDVIAKLKENNLALQQELVLRKQATDKILNGQQKSNEALIEISRKEVLELRSQLTQQQHLRLSSDKSLYETTIELKRWRQEAKILQVENNILKQNIDDYEFKLANAENPSDSKTNEEEKTKESIDNKKECTKQNNSLTNEKEIDLVDTSDTNLCTKSHSLKTLIEKHKSIPMSKQDQNLFCKQRTLTLIENDLLYKSPGRNNSMQKYDVPDLPPYNVCDSSFEVFDNDLTLDKPIPENIYSEIKNESVIADENKKIKFEEINKENVGSNSNLIKNIEKPIIKKPTVQEEGNSKMKRKVCFSEETKNEEKPKFNSLRGGKILVPKKKIILVSSAAKKV